MTRLRPFVAEPGRGAFLFNSGWLLGDRVLRIGLGLLVNVMLARAYGPAEFGLYAYALTMAALFVPLGTLGLERITVRELARDPAAEPAMLGSVGLMRLAGGMAGWMFATLWVSLTSGASPLAAILVAWIAAGNVWAAFDVVDWSFQGRASFRPATLARLGAFVVGAAAKLTLAWNGGGLRAIAAVVLGEAVLSALLQVVIWRRYGGRLHLLRFDRTLARRMLVAGAPLLAADIAVWLFQKLDVVVLAHVASPREIGFYSVAQRVAQAFYFLPGLAVQLLSPRVAQAAGTPAALAVVQRAANWLVLAAGVLAAVLTFGAGPLIRGLFGDAYDPAVIVLALLAWTNVFVFLGSAHALYLVNRGEQVLLLRLSWVTALVSVGLNLGLIPRWHAMGAAVANVTAYALTTLFGVALFAGSRPLLRLNLQALAFPFAWVLPGGSRSAPPAR